MNNYDNNSKGLSLEFNGIYDTILSQDIFNENFTKHNDQWVYNPSLQYKDLEHEFTLNKGVIFKQLLFKVVNEYYDDDSLYDGFKGLRQDFFNNISWKDLTVDDIKGFIDEILQCEIETIEFFDNCGLVTGNYTEVNITGYSQGDYATVIVFNKLELTFDPKSYFEQLFYDAPITGSLTIEGKEYYINEYLEDEYKWDKEKFLNLFFNKNKFTKKDQEIITKFLPLDLEYL